MEQQGEIMMETRSLATATTVGGLQQGIKMKSVEEQDPLQTLACALFLPYTAPNPFEGFDPRGND